MHGDVMSQCMDIHFFLESDDVREVIAWKSIYQSYFSSFPTYKKYKYSRIILLLHFFRVVQQCKFIILLESRDVWGSYRKEAKNVTDRQADALTSLASVEIRNIYISDVIKTDNYLNMPADDINILKPIKYEKSNRDV